MRSNGFGSFFQEIVIEIPLAKCEEASGLLSAEPFELDHEAGVGRFMYERRTTRTGDDEDIVFDLWRLLPQALEWRVNWERSRY